MILFSMPSKCTVISESDGKTQRLEIDLSTCMCPHSPNGGQAKLERGSMSLVAYSKARNANRLPPETPQIFKNVRKLLIHHARFWRSMRLLVFAFVAIVLLQCLVAATPSCTVHTPVGTVCKIEASVLRPTQFGIGIQEVNCKKHRFEQMSPSKLQDFLSKFVKPFLARTFSSLLKFFLQSFIYCGYIRLI
jgi:hypothetical protein